MDAIAPELLMALAGGTAGAAGQQLWASLRDLVRPPTQCEEPCEEDELTVLVDTANTAERARELAGALMVRAQQNPAFAQALESWGREVEALGDAVTGAGEVTNTISGGTQNTVVQARDIRGSINLGG
ncbi:hypothetical protein CLM62_23295 [Streptomyces sp. SA15]|nr:hypothetical protein CLM62_23295 [Streptomyces sp. SA15]